MAKSKVITGYSKNGLPYYRIGSGSRTLVLFDGLSFNHKPPSGFMLKMIPGSIKLIAESFTVYTVGRKPDLPAGYSIQDMAADYATMIREELEPPVDIMGLSTGGPIAQYFVVDYPELVNRLVLASTGHRLSDYGKLLQRRLADQALAGRWSAGAATLAEGIFSGVARPLMVSIFWLFGNLMFGNSANPLDGIVEIEAEDRHDFTDRLAEIRMPTLVIGGELDKFYSIRQMAEGIPNARLVLFKNTGHAAMMKRRFGENILAFLNEDTV
jgi:pimeloyl-ACP methyl ester carboxylesterase